MIRCDDVKLMIHIVQWHDRWQITENDDDDDSYDIQKKYIEFRIVGFMDMDMLPFHHLWYEYDFGSFYLW